MMRTMLHPKLTILILSSIFFSILYMFLDDNHFSGVNFVKETIKEEVIKKKIHSEIETQPKDVAVEPMTFINDAKSHVTTNFADYSKQKETDVAIADATKEVSVDVKTDELAAEKINVSIYQHMFDRLYFSLNTSCLLGYGDIYPLSNIAKTITMIQALVTVSLIVF